jgi:hypothetical protein
MFTAFEPCKAANFAVARRGCIGTNKLAVMSALV